MFEEMPDKNSDACLHIDWHHQCMSNFILYSCDHVKCHQHTYCSATWNVIAAVQFTCIAHDVTVSFVPESESD